MTCEDVLSKAGGAAIFAVESGLLGRGGAKEVLRGGGAVMQVLDRQAVGQGVGVQVRTGPQLSIESNINTISP